MSSLPSTNLSFSVCSTTIGNATPASNDDLSADILFGDDWTANNALGIKGYGQQQTSGNNRIANVPTGSAINLSSYLGLTVLGDSSAIGGGTGTYHTYWDNQLGGATNDNFLDLYFRLWDYSTVDQLTNQYLTDLQPSTVVGPTNIGNGVPLVHYAYWQVEFKVDRLNTNPFTFELLCSTDNGANYSSILTVNQTWIEGITYTFTWNDSGNNSVETANPTSGYAFQMLFYP
jgi:hypothetical protein